MGSYCDAQQYCNSVGQRRAVAIMGYFAVRLNN